MKLIEKITLFFKIKFIYIPYFKDVAKSYKKLCIYNKNIDKKIIDIYNNLLVDKEKYKTLITIFDNYNSSLLIHNEEVNYINNFHNNFNYINTLNNINEINENEYNKYKSIIYRYNIDKNHKTKHEQIMDIINNYNDICYQYNNKDYLINPINYEDRYITKKEINIINNKYNEIKSKIEKHSKNYYDIKLYDNLDNIINNYNETFVNNHLHDKLFDDINGKSLDNDQRRAILRNDNACLTIAGAGSGKTLTICGKVRYLLEKENVKPNEILLLSYSKKSADDLLNKMTNISLDIKVGTFHKLGLEILKSKNNTNYIVEDQFDEIIDRYFRNELTKRPKIAAKLLLYYSLYMNYDEDKESSINEKYKELKEKDYKTLKDMLGDLSPNINKKKTLKKEIVKSYEELAIANFYFINGINYTYEKTYKLNDRKYQPDFYLDDYDIYHEHYGIDKDGQAKQFGEVDGAKYVENMNIKRKIHDLNKTICLETYSYQFKDNTLFDSLKKQLIDKGVKFNPLNDKQIFNALNSIFLNHEFNSLINIIKSFINLYKARYNDDSYFDKLLKISNLNNINQYNRKRYKLFIDICKDIYQYYYSTIRDNNRIDFDDMILKASDYISSLDNYKYKYIIVDEFQDISISRMKFLKEIIKHGNSQLFAVGDDYQAIYRFSGCDLSIFIDFKDYFGDCVINYINSTHRNSQELQNIVNPFISKNPRQFNKNIKSDIHLDNPINLVYFENKKKYNGFLNVLKIINEEYQCSSILVLGRNNRDVNDIIGESVTFNKRKNEIICNDYPFLHMKFSTVHASKGLEDEIVILINADNDKLGFPNKIEDDPVLSLLLSDKDDYPFSEERRLFYVALTRTKSKVYVLVNERFPSIFIKEIEKDCNIYYKKITKHEDIKKCPKCGGELLLRNSSDGKSFYSCSNYPYCKYSINDLLAVKRNIRCPKCGDFLVHRVSKNGFHFLGCHNYPACKYIKK